MIYLKHIGIFLQMVFLTTSLFSQESYHGSTRFLRNITLLDNKVKIFISTNDFIKNETYIKDNIIYLQEIDDKNVFVVTGLNHNDYSEAYLAKIDKFGPNIKSISLEILLSIPRIYSLAFSDPLNVVLEDLNLDSTVVLAIDESTQSIIIESDFVTIFSSFLSDKRLLAVNAIEITPNVESNISDGDITVNSINYVHRYFEHLTGHNQTVGIKDLGLDNSDLDLRGRVIESNLVSELKSQHATEMATIVAGSAMTSSKSQGVADQAALIGSDFNNLYADPIIFIRDNNISVQNHSYGTLLENFYGVFAMSYDAQVYKYPYITHVFSAGNLGTATDSLSKYFDVPGFGTITGNFKQAKNVITVGATDRLNRVISISSKGPAYDGRIKPEMVAFGSSGTSSSAALVSGTALLLNQLYQEMNVELPPACLVKGILLNTANKIDNKIINYQSGFGSLNAKQAVETLNHQQYFTATLGNKDTLKFQIKVPENAKELRVLLCWNDPPGSVNSLKALVHDLDLELVEDNNMRYLPWVLNSYPNIDSLKMSPKRGKDRLNNVEQITISDPISKTYHIEVIGYDLKEEQDFAVIYNWQMEDHFKWIYPSQGESLLPVFGNKSFIRWDANLNQSIGSLYIKYKDESSWVLLYDSLNIASEIHEVEIPNKYGIANLKIVVDESQFISDTFTISPLIEPTLGFACEDSIMVIWGGVENVKKYLIYTTGSKSLELIKESEDTVVILGRQVLDEGYFSVEPVFDQNYNGPKSETLNVSNFFTDCFFSSIQADSDGNSTNIFIYLGTSLYVEKVVLKRRERDGFIIVEEAEPYGTAQTDYFFRDNPDRSGFLEYECTLILENGHRMSKRFTVLHLTGESPFYLFPNPVKNGSSLKIYKSSQIDHEPIVVTLFDLKGRLLIERQLISDRDFLPISNLTEGLYIVQLKRGERNFEYKLLVSK